MSDSLLRDDILAFLSAHASGSAHATPRRNLLMYLQTSGHSICDRRMRAQLSAMPECGSCLKGIFIILNAEDRRIAGTQLHGRAMAELHREKRIKDAAPAGQLGLWEEEK